MQRRTYLAGVGSIATAGLAGCSALGSGDGGDDGSNDALENASFEDGVTGWTVGKDLPPEPGEDTGTVDHGVTTVDGNAADGDSAVQFYVSGIADDGTIWVEQTVDLSSIAAVDVAVYSRQESFNDISHVAFFAGEKPDDGLVEADFDREQNVEDHAGWKTYRYSVDDVAGTATLAVGMTVIWETEVRRLFDDVRLVDDGE